MQINRLERDFRLNGWSRYKTATIQAQM